MTAHTIERVGIIHHRKCPVCLYTARIVPASRSSSSICNVQGTPVFAQKRRTVVFAMWCPDYFSVFTPGQHSSRDRCTQVVLKNTLLRMFGEERLYIGLFNGKKGVVRSACVALGVPAVTGGPM